MSLRVIWNSENDAKAAILDGRIDSSNTALFKQSILEGTTDEDRVLILEFSKVNFISSAGLRVVLELAKAFRPPKSFSVCGLSFAVREVFEISGFDQIVSVYGTLEEARSKS